MVAWRAGSGNVIVLPDWLLLTPDNIEADGAALLAFRARVLGERFATFDDADRAAYHVVARGGAAVVACARVLPLAVPVPGFTERGLGPERFGQLLDALGVVRRACAEGGRWCVDVAERDGRLSICLLAGLHLIQARLGVTTSLVSARVEQGQDRILRRLGFVEGPPFAEFDDPSAGGKHRVLVFDLRRPFPVPSALDAIQGLALEVVRPVVGPDLGE